MKSGYGWLKGLVMLVLAVLYWAEYIDIKVFLSLLVILAGLKVWLWKSCCSGKEESKASMPASKPKKKSKKKR